jgi:hypothetical protein
MAVVAQAEQQQQEAGAEGFGIKKPHARAETTAAGMK